MNRFIRHFSKYKAPRVPKAVREQVWIKHMGKKYESKCYIKWCQSTINVFDFSLGDNVPVSKGGSDRISNLHPICCRCNTCMGNKYTIKEWNKAF